jgi:8-oxo-dGTP pyrophosphatase MutT (NUDIX family)
VRNDSLSRSRRLSCGVVILCPKRELLLCHVTGQHHWDLPKGGIHDGETPRQAALRETVEETGLILAAQTLVDLGGFAYTAKKDLHLFATVTARIDPRSLCCESTFVERGSGRTLPEMDAFGWFAFDRVRDLCTPRMAALLELKVGLDATLGGLLVSSAERLAA